MKDVIGLLDAKADADDVNRALLEVNRQITLKASLECVCVCVCVCVCLCVLCVCVCVCVHVVKLQRTLKVNRLSRNYLAH